MAIRVIAIAIVCLMACGSARAEDVTALAARMKGGDHVERLRAAEALAELGPAASRATTDLVEALADRYMVVRRAAERASGAGLGFASTCAAWGATRRRARWSRAPACARSPCRRASRASATSTSKRSGSRIRASL